MAAAGAVGAVAAHGGVALAQSAAGDTTIHVVIVESHDRVLPTPIRGIVKRGDFDIVLKPDKQIQESARRTNYAPGPGNRTFEDRTGDHAMTLGGDQGHAVWHVLGPNKLQRMFQNPQTQLLSVWTIETDANRGCRIDAKILFQEGTTVTGGKIAGFDTPATFTNYKVLQASCTIE